MPGIKEIVVNEYNKLFDTTGMFHKKFASDFRQIQKAPPAIKEINLLEQQISELIKNAVKHGNKSDPAKHIQVWYSFSE